MYSLHEFVNAIKTNKVRKTFFAKIRRAESRKLECKNGSFFEKLFRQIVDSRLENDPINRIGI